MKDSVSITLSLDKRRIKINGKYPLKICVYQKYPKIQKYYPTKYEFTEEEYSEIIYPIKGNKEKRSITKIREELHFVKNKAENVANKIDPFNFELFDKKLYANKSQESDVFYQYDLCIQKKTDEGDINTASNYRCSKNAFIKFQEYKKIKSPNLLDFRSANEQFLKDFEKYFLEVKNGSISTVGSYTRTLKAIFNIAKESNIITENYYPFGKRKYITPSSSKVKKALSKEELLILYNSKPLTIGQEIAKDFWFFSYMCYGMNVKDICLLKYDNIKKDSFQFVRAKTKKRIRTNIHPIIIPLTDETIKTIEKYSTKSSLKSDYVFGKISDNMSAIEKQKKVNAFNRLINQHIKKLAISAGLEGDLSVVWARHSFATMLIRSSGSYEMAQQCLGHTSKKTTEVYFSGFTSETLKEISKGIMNFK
jgi:integrase/recombinase XerD